jgi:hypothetical protein
VFLARYLLAQAFALRITLGQRFGGYLDHRFCQSAISRGAIQT